MPHSQLEPLFAMETQTENLERITNSTDEIRSKAETWVQEKPTDAVLAAAGVGFLVALLPLGKLLRALLGLAFSLLKPALLILGVMKLVEEVQAGCCDEESAGESGRGAS
jgi:hypothetical protein